MNSCPNPTYCPCLFQVVLPGMAVHTLKGGNGRMEDRERMGGVNFLNILISDCDISQYIVTIYTVTIYSHNIYCDISTV